MKIIQCTQLSGAWFQAHCACVTGSGMAAVLDFTQERVLKNGEKRGGVAGSKRLTYFRLKLGELLTGIAVHENYVSWEMRAGIDKEPLARAAYESEERVMVEEIGFALHDSIPRLGGSVDGLVGDDGIIEIKSPKDGTHFQSILDSCIPPQYLPQIDTYLSVTGRAWCDFVSFCPEAPRALRTMVIRREKDEDAIRAIEAAAIQFNAEVDAAVDRLRAIVGNFDLPAQVQDDQDSPEGLDDSFLTEADLNLLPH